ncbi:hypothetical protein CCACVL1_14167 [Corchorus capsularis]|uniref:Uncharacterized protein n=1 Tax=Corchorus capsularis TaxID=210143 RepID=A0A1R3I7Z1_COCAP|nr:hypothetical protein CCACVL1_14167 [Corchorus capsularis]
MSSRKWDGEEESLDQITGEDFIDAFMSNFNPPQMTTHERPIRNTKKNKKRARSVKY